MKRPASAVPLGSTHYRLGSAYVPNTINGQLAAWLKSTLRASQRGPNSPGLQQVRGASCQPGSASDSDSLLHVAILRVATAFTDLRRLQILRHLTHEGTATTRELVAAPQHVGASGQSSHHETQTTRISARPDAQRTLPVGLRTDWLVQDARPWQDVRDCAMCVAEERIPDLLRSGILIAVVAPPPNVGGWPVAPQ